MASEKPPRHEHKASGATNHEHLKKSDIANPLGASFAGIGVGNHASSNSNNPMAAAFNTGSSSSGNNINTHMLHMMSTSFKMGGKEPMEIVYEPESYQRAKDIKQ
jgi:hypothetical protein